MISNPMQNAERLPNASRLNDLRLRGEIFGSSLSRYAFSHSRIVTLGMQNHTHTQWMEITQKVTCGPRYGHTAQMWGRDADVIARTTTTYTGGFQSVMDIQGVLYTYINIQCSSIDTRPTLICICTHGVVIMPTLGLWS